MTAIAPVQDVPTLVALWARAPGLALLPAPAPVPRLPAPPVQRLLVWVRSAAELEALALAEMKALEARAPDTGTPGALDDADARDAAPTLKQTAPSEEDARETRGSAEPELPPRRRPDPEEEDDAPVADEAPLRSPASAAREERHADARGDGPSLDITLTVQAPNPWAIMPSRTLRGAGARHLVRKADPLDPSPTLQEQVQSEGAPAPRPEATERLWDLIIVPAQTGFRASEQGVKALVLYLDRSQLLRSPTVSTLEEFVGHPLHQTAEHWRARLRGPGAGDETRIVSLEPGEFAHQIFHEGAAPGGGPSVLRGHIGQRPRPMALPFGQEGREAAFWLALIGCRFDKPSRGFLERLHSILYLRPQVFAVPHDGA
jgi:hypothetical protein